MHEKLIAEDRRLLNNAWEISAKAMRDLDLFPIVELSSDWEDCDFGDRVHLTDAGAKKHASRVQKAIQILHH